MVGVVGPERLPLFVVQKDVGPFLLHHTDSLLGGTLVHGHQITADKGSASEHGQGRYYKTNKRATYQISTYVLGNSVK